MGEGGPRDRKDGPDPLEGERPGGDLPRSCGMTGVGLFAAVERVAALEGPPPPPLPASLIPGKRARPGGEADFPGGPGGFPPRRLQGRASNTLARSSPCTSLAPLREMRGPAGDGGRSASGRAVCRRRLRCAGWRPRGPRGGWCPPALAGQPEGARRLHRGGAPGRTRAAPWPLTPGGVPPR